MGRLSVNLIIVSLLTLLVLAIAWELIGIEVYVFSTGLAFFIGYCICYLYNSWQEKAQSEGLAYMDYLSGMEMEIQFMRARTETLFRAAGAANKLKVRRDILQIYDNKLEALKGRKRGQTHNEVFRV